MLFWWKVPDRYSHDTLTLKLSKKGLELNDTRRCDRLVDRNFETRTGWGIKVNITLWPLLLLSSLPLFSFPSEVLEDRKLGLTLPLRKWHTASSLWFRRGKKSHMIPQLGDILRRLFLWMIFMDLPFQTIALESYVTRHWSEEKPGLNVIKYWICPKFSSCLQEESLGPFLLG